MLISTDCRHFLGDRPCKPHKLHGYHCEACPEYAAKNEKILIIKLGAIGDVIRSTPLLRRIKKTYPQAVIYWLTYTPEVLSKNWVDFRLPVNLESIQWLRNIKFDWLLNLDKDPIAVSLASEINASKKNGFTADSYGLAKPISTIAETDKWQTGIFDDLNKANTKHYVQEIFEIAGLSFDGEEYVLESESAATFPIKKNGRVVGLNTGCGGRWTSRLYPIEHWKSLAASLMEKGYSVVLLGGEQEDKKNKEIALATKAEYFGFFALNDFISLMNHCDIIVSAVTMGMHIAIALKKKLVLFNNIFNPNEFYLYDRGVLLEPDPNCDCYFSPECPHDSMKKIKPERVLDAVISLTHNSSLD